MKEAKIKCRDCKKELVYYHAPVLEKSKYKDLKCNTCATNRKYYKQKISGPPPTIPIIEKKSDYWNKK